MYYDCLTCLYTPGPTQSLRSFIEDLLLEYETKGGPVYGKRDGVILKVTDESTVESLIACYEEAYSGDDCENIDNAPVMNVPGPTITTKVKIFGDVYTEDLANKINQFIKDKKEFTIQYQMSDKRLSAMIIYTEVTE